LLVSPEREKVLSVVEQSQPLQKKHAANRKGDTNQEAGVQTERKDKDRMWMWGLLAVIVMSQFYVVWELLAAFALFAVGFAVIALVVASLYVLQNCWELAATRLAGMRRPVVNMASVSSEIQKAA